MGLQRYEPRRGLGRGGVFLGMPWRAGPSQMAWREMGRRARFLASQVSKPVRPGLDPVLSMLGEPEQLNFRGRPCFLICKMNMTVIMLAFWVVVNLNEMLPQLSRVHGIE